MMQKQEDGRKQTILNADDVLPSLQIDLQPVRSIGPFVFKSDHQQQVANLMADIAVQANMIDSLCVQLRQTQLRLDKCLRNASRF